ncbi:MAG: SDR family oxidoreductase [Vicinamibacterales bacterium]|nr:SDR family oxidoreductase [Vicinamibacterales bacterium]
MTILITGGTRGIGYALAERCLAAGHHVVITGTSTDGVSRAEAALGTSVDDTTRVIGVVCDVRDAGESTRAVETAVQRFGGLDVLVNNAGVGIGAPVADLSDEEWRRILETNLTGTFHCCRAAIPHLRARGGGWIVNVSSLSSTRPFAGGAAYCASKAGLNAFTEALMEEVRADGIRVTLVLPGSVATGFSGRPAGQDSDWRLHAEDVAQAITDLLAHPPRSLPSRLEIRPAQPKRG